MGTRRDYQKIVANATNVGIDHHLIGTDRLYLRHAEEEILAVIEHLAQRGRDRIRFQPGGGHLVEQGLKRVVVVPVDHHHLHVLEVEVFKQLNAAKPPTDHHQAGLSGIGQLTG